jgi:hypothetical protein
LTLSRQRHQCRRSRRADRRTDRAQHLLPPAHALKDRRALHAHPRHSARGRTTPAQTTSICRGPHEPCARTPRRQSRGRVLCATNKAPAP